jgi:hypothetical protein
MIIDTAEQMPYARIAWYPADEEGAAECPHTRRRLLLQPIEPSSLDQETRDLLVQVIENL